MSQPLATDFVIRGLPPEIATVPSWPADMRENGWRDRWKAWSDEIAQFRADNLDAALDNPVYAAEDRRLAAAYPEYFMAMHGFIYEPRDNQIVEDDGDEWSPWIPFPHQVWMLHWMERLMKLRRPMGDGVILKSRDMGATWTVCLYVAHQFLFAKKFSASLISYKEDMVDAALDPDSMFWKIEAVLGIIEGAPGLPRYLFDPDALGWDPVKHDRKLGLAYPGSTKFVKGSATTMKSGSGTRALFGPVDEAAKVPNLRKMLSSKRSATAHGLLVSSAYTEEGNDFREIVRQAQDDEKSGSPGMSYLFLDSRYHPHHDEEWHATELAGYQAEGNEAAYYREIKADFHAGATGWLYWDLVERADNIARGYDPTQMLYVGIDPGRRDDTAIAWANAVPVPNAMPTFHWLGVYERNLVTAQWYAHILTGIPPQPGDEYYDPTGRRWTREEEETCAFFRRAWESTGGVEIAGDPAGDQRVAATIGSFYDVLMQFSLDLRRRARDQHGEQPWCPDEPLVVYFGELFKLNDHETRRGALRAVFNRGATYDTGRAAQRLKEKHRQARFQERTREASTDPKPVHDEDSHAVAASEYMSVWLDLIGAERRKEERKKGRKAGEDRMRPTRQDERRVAA